MSDIDKKVQSGLNQIAFIICTNKDEWYDECVRFIEKLEVPDGFEVSVLKVTQAKSMTSGYNEGMHSCNAKYKIYLHQDVFIIKKNFLANMLNIFINHKEIGIMGVLGSDMIVEDGCYWDKWNVGACYAFNIMEGFYIDFDSKTGLGVKYARALDGMLLMTQYDVEWREDLFVKWDFYDVSACFEFQRQGYKAAVLLSDEIICMHDCGFSKLNDYDNFREIFCDEYSEFGFMMSDWHKYTKKTDAKDFICQLDKLMQSDLEGGKKFIEEHKRFYHNNDVWLLKIAFDIYMQEQKEDVKNYFIQQGDKCADIIEKYTRLKFLIREVEFDICSENAKKLYLDLINGKISICAIQHIADRCCKSPQVFWNKMKNSNFL